MSEMIGPQAAEAAGLVYVSDDMPGYSRRRAGSGWAFYDPKGRLERDAVVRRRLQALAVPPAWRDVWYCSSPQGHLQSTGRDAKGRKQYRYHPDWRTHADAVKFERMPWLGAELPRLRQRIEADLAAEEERTRVLAAVVSLLDHGAIRIGGESSDAFGAATLRKRHVEAGTKHLRLHFTGKGGKQQDVALTHPRLARIVRRLTTLPGQRLFQYRRAGGQLSPVQSSDVNDYLRQIAGSYLTAKEFRTWGGSTAAVEGLLEEEPPSVKAVLARAAQRLGNTPAIARKSYVAPMLVEMAKQRQRPSPLQPRPGLSTAEETLLDLLSSGQMPAPGI